MPQSAYASNSGSSLPLYARNTLNGQTARERELKRLETRYADDREVAQLNKWEGVRTEFDVLKENHR